MSAPAASASPSPTPIYVILNGVVARDAAGLRGASRGSLQSVTAHLGPGVHAFLGAPEDGTIALCDVIAGVRPALRGTVLVYSADPWKNPPIRSTIGALLAAPDIPDARTVRRSVQQAILALGRALAEADAVLPALGLGALADRSPSSLSFGETRAVELALALHVARVVAMRAAPPVLVLFEPFADLALPSMRVVEEAIAAQRAAGACVILATSSPADARRVADHVWVLHAGALVRREPGDGRTLSFGDAELAVWFPASATGSSASLRVVAASLSAHPAVRAAYWEDPPAGSGRPPVLRVRGPDRDACALAILDAAASSRIAVEAITSASPDLGAVRSASLAWLHRMRSAQRIAPRGLVAPSVQQGPVPPIAPAPENAPVDPRALPAAVVAAPPEAPSPSAESTVAPAVAAPDAGPPLAPDVAARPEIASPPDGSESGGPPA